MKFIIHQRYITLAQVLLLPLAIAFSSCKKLIEIPANPNDKVSTPRVYSDSLNVLGALTGIYANFGTGGFGGSINTGYTSIYTSLASDELVSLNPNEFYANEIQVTSGTVSEIWRTAYAGIYQCNAFLEGLAASDGVSASFRQQVTGEVLTARSLYYFHLVNQFGDVPIITGTDFKVNALQKRMPADSVYDFILKDLTSAAGMLKVQYPSPGRMRPNLHVARALLAKVYLYSGAWQQAADLSGQIIESGTYELVDPTKTFLDGSKEALWQMPSLSTFAGIVDAMSLVPWSNTIAPNYYLSSYLTDAFEANDLRKQAWLSLNTVVSGTTTTPYYYPGKYKKTDVYATPLEGYMIFRLSEQYLINAEALAKLNQLDAARMSLNKVRNRAGLLNTTAVSQDEVLAAIEKERFTELFAEQGNRWYDLKRTGKITSVLGERKPGFTATDALYPIPLNEINTNINMTQNPGY